MIARPGVADVW